MKNQVVIEEVIQLRTPALQRVRVRSFARPDHRNTGHIESHPDDELLTITIYDKSPLFGKVNPGDILLIDITLDRERVPV